MRKIPYIFDVINAVNVALQKNNLIYLNVGNNLNRQKVVFKSLDNNPKSPNYLALYKADKVKIMENMATIANTVKQILNYANENG